MAETLRAAAAGAEEAARLVARISRLLEEAAHRGARALRLMVQARELCGLAAAGDDEATAALLHDLERRVAEAEREGRHRLRSGRPLVIGAPKSRARARVFPRHGHR